ncbi:MAG: FGGY family carbohydrate kinase [Candidatus Bathyarchaeia archaeon]
MKEKGAYLLCSDIGTSSVKTKLYNLEGEAIGSVRREYKLNYPGPGWVEAHPDIIWSAFQASVRRLLKSVGIDSGSIECISISGMTPSCLPVDKNGDPLRPALIWCDSRATEECNWIRDSISLEMIHRVSGNMVAPYFGGPKWLWFKNNEAMLFGKAWKLLQCNSYIVYRLTGEAVIDYSQAGLCAPFFDIRRKSWSYEICNMLGFDMDILPEIFSSFQVVGETSASCRSLGLKGGIPVVAGGGDFACSALGCGVFNVGDACQMLGTAGDFIIPTRGDRFDPRLVNTIHVDGNYVSFGNVLAGGVVSWYRGILATFAKGNDIDFQTLEREARRIPPGSEGLIVLPQLIGGIAPEWDLYRRGVIFGISTSHGPFHIYRAILEGVAYALRYILEIALEAGAKVKSVVAVDGGAKSRLWRRILADAMNLPLTYYISGRDATMGDAALAAKGLGYISGFHVVRGWLGEAEVDEPDPQIHKEYISYYQLYREIYGHLGEDFRNLFETIRREPK